MRKLINSTYISLDGAIQNPQDWPSLGSRLRRPRGCVSGTSDSCNDDNALGLAVWSSVHGLAMLVLRNVIDLGQRKSGLDVLPSRAEIILRSLFSTRRD